MVWPPTSMCIWVPNTYKGPLLFNPMQINPLHFNLCLLNSVFCMEAVPLGHPAKLWWQRYLCGSSPHETISNIYTMLGCGMTLTHLHHNSSNPISPKRTEKITLVYLRSFQHLILKKIINFGWNPEHRHCQDDNIKCFTRPHFLWLVTSLCMCAWECTYGCLRITSLRMCLQ